MTINWLWDENLSNKLLIGLCFATCLRVPIDGGGDILGEACFANWPC